MCFGLGRVAFYHCGPIPDAEMQNPSKPLLQVSYPKGAMP